MQQPYVFISYASANRDRAERLAALLEGAGVGVWLDRMSITGGTSWSAEIVRGIKGCGALVLLVSQQSVNSPNVQQEVQLAWENRRALLPMLLEQCDLPDQLAYPLAGRQWVEMLDLPEERWVPRALHALTLLGVAPDGGAVPSEGTAFASARAVAAAAAPLAAPAAVHHNLPTQLNEFIGRDAELEELCTVIRANRLVTLTGAGGVGKTRLALQAAEALMKAFPGGVWLAELAPLTDPARVPQAVAAALDLYADPERPATDILTQHLKGRQALILLDNCEHVIAEAAALVQRLLRACPGLRMIATSREALRVAGETIWRVQPLRAPEPDRLPLPAQMAEFDAVRLFINRAAAVMPGFAVTYQNAPAIAQICQRLEGIPLAIELAAARVQVLSVEHIAERLDDIFRLLRGGSRTAPSRQQALRALFDWSYDLLTEPERALWRRLSVFAGSFALDAAEAVCAGGEVEEWEVLDLITALVDKSLVVNLQEDGEVRYRLLVPLRQYGADRLTETGEEPAVRRRHFDWYLKLAETYEAKCPGPDEAVLFERMGKDYENVLAALTWAVRTAQADLALRLSTAMAHYWMAAAYSQDAHRWLSAACELAGGTEVAHKYASCWRLYFVSMAADAHKLQPAARELVAWSEAHGDLALLGRALIALSGVLFRGGQLEETLLIAERAVDVLGRAGSPFPLAESHHIRCFLYDELGKTERYRETTHEFWAFIKSLPACPTMADLAVGPFSMAIDWGEIDFAEEIAHYAFGLVCNVRRHPMKGIIRGWLADLALSRGQLKEAETLVREALTHLREDPRTHESLSFYVRTSVFRMARMRHEAGDLERTIRLLGAIGDGWLSDTTWTARNKHAELLSALKATVDETTFRRLWAEGKAMTIGQAVDYALMTT